MPRLSSLAAALVAVLATGGCDLDVANPNDLDQERAFSDPAALEFLMGGAFRNWGATRGDYFMMPLNAMADNYTASWNNAAIRFYSSVGSDCPSRCGWTNSSTAPEAAGGPIPEASWYGYYTVFSSATDVLREIAAGLCFDADCTVDSTVTSRNRVIARMLQAMALAGIALLYDQGFAVDETADLSDALAVLAIPFNTRAEVRDFALQKFEEAWVEAGTATWSTPAAWMGVGGGRVYTNNQIRRLIRTMQAELVALFPRNAAENAAADWAQVAAYASEGISSGTPFDWEYFVDVNSSANSATFTLDWVKAWGNSIGTMRVDTRVAKLLDPLSQEDPWPGAPGTLGNPLTRVTAAVSGSGSPQTITPLSATNIATGRLLAIGCAPADPSCVGDRFVVTGTTATTFTAVITQSYAGPTTLSAPVVHDTTEDGDPASVAATPASMSGISAGAFLWIDDVAANNEAVIVDSVTATTFFAKFLKDHAAAAVVAPAIHRNGGSPGNWCPLTSPDLRVGDGSWGPSDDFNGFATIAETGNEGTDFACSGVAIFPPARGQYHQSNLQHVRYNHLGYNGENLPEFDGAGQDPLYTREMNDLLWAEGLLRQPTPDPVAAAGLINNSRVGRGGLSPLTGAEGIPALLAALQYEQEIEFMGQGSTPFFNRRRIDGLITGTPRHMPVPAKEMEVLAREIYTFGGPSDPDMAPSVGGTRSGVRSVGEIWRDYLARRSATRR